MISFYQHFNLLHFSFNVTVPQFIQASLPHVMVISAKVGEGIELYCSSDGHAHPEALWYKYNIPLLDITYRTLEGTLKFRKLVLNNLLLADAGNYSCWVNDTLGSINRTFIVYVYGEYTWYVFSHPMSYSLSCGRCIGLMVSVPDSRSSGLFPGIVVCLLTEETLLKQHLSPPRCIMGTNKLNADWGTLQWTIIPTSGK